MDIITIQPSSQTIVQTIYGYNIQVKDIVLGQKVNILVKMFDSEKKFVKMKILTMEGQDYQNWGADDNYVYSWVETQMGFSTI